MAQKKQLQTVRGQIKSGKKLTKAENALRGLLVDSAPKKNSEIRFLLCDALAKQYEWGSEKLYSKQKYSAATLFTVTGKLYDVMSRSDSLDAQPSAKGRVRAKYRAKHINSLNFIRPNLFNGGSYFIHRRNYKVAFGYYSDYLPSANYPLFEGYDYMRKDTFIPRATYWAIFRGYKPSDADKITQFKEQAERNTSMLNPVRQYGVEAYLVEKDTAAHVKSLQASLEQHPNFTFLFPRLVEYYAKIGEHQRALEIMKHASKADSASLLFHFAKSTALLSLSKYNKCIEICKQLIKDRDTYADAYYSIRFAYFNQAIELNKDRQKCRASKEKIITLCQRSKPYMEKYREFASAAKNKQLAPLYAIYLNLDMNKELDEIDKLREKR